MKHQALIISLSCMTAVMVTACMKNKQMIPCGAQEFQSLNNAANNYGWGDDNYIKAKSLAEDDPSRVEFCTNAIKFRGTAYCKVSYDPIYKQSLKDAIALCPNEAKALGIGTRAEIDANTDLPNNAIRKLHYITIANNDASTESTAVASGNSVNMADFPGFEDGASDNTATEDSSTEPLPETL